MGKNDRVFRTRADLVRTDRRQPSCAGLQYIDGRDGQRRRLSVRNGWRDSRCCVIALTRRLGRTASQSEDEQADGPFR